MLKVIRARLQQGHRTMRYPDGPPPELPDRFHGAPQIGAAPDPAAWTTCAAACPAGAMGATPAAGLNLARCIFCGACARTDLGAGIVFSPDYRLATRHSEDLLVRPGQNGLPRAAPLETRMRKLFGRSLKLRQVSAGGCNACESDVNVLNTLAWDLGRFGIQFVAAPRHADGLLITGPVPRNMMLALKKTYDAVPDPKLVIAVGACALSGGLYRDRPEVANGADKLIPVDLYIAGCPPHPLTILDGLLRLLGRVD